MRAAFRVLLWLAVVVLALAALLYAGSEWIIRRAHSVPLEGVAVPRDDASLAEGARLARITGCAGCHDDHGQGRVLAESALLGRIVAPALARSAARYTDIELARLIRHGVRRDGSALFIMPTGAHSWLADDDTGRVIAWVRSLRPRDDDLRATLAFGPLARALIVAGALPSSVHPGSVAAHARPADPGGYFVAIACTGCHALDHDRTLEDGEQIAPALAPIAAAYDDAAFRTLLRTGKGQGGRELGLMSVVARNDLSVLTDGEIAAIHAYLRAEAGRMKPQ